jgi:glycosyltransferase involved in cell wall biosynthesis
MRETMTRNRIALFLPNLHAAGAERVMVHLANGLAQRDHPVDMVLVRAEGAFLSDLGAGVQIVDLQSTRTFSAILPLARYLAKQRPAVLFSALEHANVSAVFAGWLSGAKTHIVPTLHVPRTMDLRTRRGFKAVILHRCIKWCYRRASALVCVSADLADDLVRVLNLDRRKVHVIYNPVIHAGIESMSREGLEHPWFAPGQPPVILAVGRLMEQKDHGTLLRAVSTLRRTLDVRLVILGEGPERPRLEALVRSLGLESSVSMPGLVTNPYAYMARADLFVLSSAWEALPTVLIEALAVGAKVVSTDCMTGPAEILQGGRYGNLTPVGDPVALAEAMSAALSTPRQAVPAEALLPYTMDYALDEYCRLIAEVTGE